MGAANYVLIKPDVRMQACRVVDASNPSAWPEVHDYDRLICIDRPVDAKSHSVALLFSCNTGQELRMAYAHREPGLCSIGFLAQITCSSPGGF